MSCYGLESDLRRLTEENRRLKKEVREIGEGKLRLREKNGRLYYLEYINGKQCGITKRPERAYRLARKELLTDEIIIKEKTIEVLKKANTAISKIEKESKREQLTDKYKSMDFHKILMSDEELKWFYNSNSHNDFKQERLKYMTSAGVMTRSKSERFIGDFLESRGLIYMYEPKLRIGERVVYPDFMILRPDGKEVIWEHCGLMDNSEYFNKMIFKLNDYRKLGYVQHHNLICTYEEDLTDTKQLEAIIHRFIYC